MIQAGLDAKSARRQAPQLVSVVVPCLNEEAVIPRLRQRLTAAAESWGCGFEVLVVDDGSTDRSWELLQAICDNDPRWHALRLSRNFGHQAAVSAGLSYARGDCTVALDGDLQDPPEEIARFIEAWRNGYDVIYGIRMKRKESVLKRAAYAVFYRTLARLAEISIPLDAGDFCLMDRKVVDLLNRLPERGRFIRGLRAWAGFSQVGVPYERQARGAGVPQYTVVKLVRLALDGFFSFSVGPLRLATYMGFLVSGLALLGAVFTFFQRLFPDQFARIGLRPVPGFATTVISILFLGGVQLICLGILGEYLGRIYEEVKGRPLWVIRDARGFPVETAGKGTP